MPVPFETLLPYGIMIAMFGITGTGLAAFRSWQNDGKNPRYSLDQWDRQSTTPTIIERSCVWFDEANVYSDGARPPIDRELEGSDSTGYSTAWLRIKQSLEDGETLQLIELSNETSEVGTGCSHTVYQSRKRLDRRYQLEDFHCQPDSIVSLLEEPPNAELLVDNDTSFVID